MRVMDSFDAVLGIYGVASHKRTPELHQEYSGRGSGDGQGSPCLLARSLAHGYAPPIERYLKGLKTTKVYTRGTGDGQGIGAAIGKMDK